jgi:HSP20 family protein
MYPIFRENLFRNLFDFRQDFDELFNRLLVGFPMTTEPTLRTVGFTPLADVWIDPDTKKFYLRVAVPGVDPKDVKVEVIQGNTLRIFGEHKAIETKKEVNFLNRELTYGTFERVLPLPEGVDVEKLTAEFYHGVMEINAPMVTAALPRRIEIKPALKKVA